MDKGLLCGSNLFFMITTSFNSIGDVLKENTKSAVIGPEHVLHFINGEQQSACFLSAQLFSIVWSFSQQLSFMHNGSMDRKRTIIASMYDSIFTLF